MNMIYKWFLLGAGELVAIGGLGLAGYRGWIAWREAAVWAIIVLSLVWLVGRKSNLWLAVGGRVACQGPSPATWYAHTV